MPETPSRPGLSSRPMRQDRFTQAAYGVLFFFLAVQLALMLWLDFRG